MPNPITFVTQVTKPNNERIIYSSGLNIYSEFPNIESNKELLEIKEKSTPLSFNQNLAFLQGMQNNNDAIVLCEI